jgi:hypothetical protein
MCSFVRVQFYISAQNGGTGTIAAQASSDLIRSIAGATENLGDVSFGIGSLLFFYLFLKSRYIPKVLAAVGMSASVIWTGLYLCQFDIPGTSFIIPVHLFSAYGRS